MTLVWGPNLFIPSMVLGIKSVDICTLGKHSTTELCLPALPKLFEDSWFVIRDCIAEQIIQSSSFSGQMRCTQNSLWEVGLSDYRVDSHLQP